MWLIFLLLLSATASAAEVAPIPEGLVVTKEEVVTKAPYSDATFGPPFVIPADSKGPLRIALDLDQTELEDDATDLKIELWVYNGIFYVLDAAAHYIGGKHVDKEGKPQTQPPGFWLNSSEYLNKTVRIRIVPAPKKTITAGATVEVAK